MIFRTLFRSGMVMLLAGGALVAGTSLPAAAADATTSASPSSASYEVHGATLSWGIDNEANSQSYSGQCNFLSAGKAGNTGASTLWTATSPSPGYQVSDGAVTVRRADPKATTPLNWQNRCTDASGKPLTLSPTKTYADTTVNYTGGTGTVNPITGEATVQWAGSFTVVFYGGLTYWTATDPKLTVHSDGTGELTAELSGYGASQTDSSKWAELHPVENAPLATFSGINVRTAVDAAGFTVTPDFAQTTVTTPTGEVTGAWPQEFVNFQEETGQSSYWYSSGTGDADKVPLPLSIGYTSAYGETPVPGSSLAPKTPTSPATNSASGQSLGTGIAPAAAAPAPQTSGNVSGGTAAESPAASPQPQATQASSSPAAAAAPRRTSADTPRRIGLGLGALGASLVLPVGGGYLIRRKLGLDPRHLPTSGV